MLLKPSRLRATLFSGSPSVHQDASVLPLLCSLLQPPVPFATIQDALSAEITARRRNAVRLAEAQAAASEGGRESAVQAASGLRARCLELEELVVRLTKDVQIAKEDLSSQVCAELLVLTRAWT